MTAADVPAGERGGRLWPWRPVPMPARTPCRGCGRPIATAGLKRNRRFYCLGCGQMMRASRKQARFRYDEDHRRREARRVHLLAAALGLFPVAAVLFMADNSPSWAHHAVPYTALALAAGGGAAALFRRARRVSNDPQWWGAIVLILSGLEREVLAAIGWMAGSAFPLRGTWLIIVNGLVMLAALPLARRIWPSR